MRVLREFSMVMLVVGLWAGGAVRGQGGSGGSNEAIPGGTVQPGGVNQPEVAPEPVGGPEPVKEVTPIDALPEKDEKTPGIPLKVSNFEEPLRLTAGSQYLLTFDSLLEAKAAGLIHISDASTPVKVEMVYANAIQIVALKVGTAAMDIPFIGKGLIELKIISEPQDAPNAGTLSQNASAPIALLQMESSETAAEVSNPFSPQAYLDFFPTFNSFVHERRTVRTSERTAEIWVSFPEGLECKIFVNHVEYPYEGEFRIFKTRINSFAPRRFYLSARYWNATNKGWEKLPQAKLMQEGIPLSDCQNIEHVDLMHGQRVSVEFPAPSSPTPHPPASISKEEFQQLLEAQLSPLAKELNTANEQSTLQAKTLKQQSGQIAKLLLKSEEIRKTEKLIQDRLAKLEVPATPHAHSSKVTRQFHFDETATKIIGDSDTDTNTKGIKSVTWTQHPSTVVMSVLKSVTPMPAQPFSATVTFLIQSGKDNSFYQQKVDVKFEESGQHLVAAIPFHKDLAVFLEQALVDNKQSPGKFHLRARIDYEVQMGDLGTVRIAGPVGNEIDLNIVP